MACASPLRYLESTCADLHADSHADASACSHAHDTSHSGQGNLNQPGQLIQPDQPGRVERILRQAASSSLLPPPTSSIAEWAELYRWVAPPSPHIGQWRNSRTPYLTGVMEPMSPCHPCREVSLMKATQMGGTEALINAIGFYSHLAPTTGMVVLPTQGVAEEWAKSRFEVLFETTPVLQGMIQNTSARRANNMRNTTLFKRLRGGVGSWKFAWATSAKMLRSTPAEIVIADEVDAFEVEIRDEGDPVDLLRKRMSNYTRGKLILCSSPTSRSTSRIEYSYAQGDQRRFFIPCPYCRWWQVLQFGNLFADDKGPYFKCVRCGQRIREHQKGQFLPEGVWLATRDWPGMVEAGVDDAEMQNGESIRKIRSLMRTAEVVSLHLPAFYSPYGWPGKNWDTLFREWERAKNDSSRKRVFVNTNLAETWADEEVRLDWQSLWARREEYTPGVVPKGGLFLTAACDVQGDRLEVEVKAWGRGKQSWPVWYEVIGIPPENPQSWQELTRILETDWQTEENGRLPIYLMVIDSNYRSNIVYDYCLRFPQLSHGPAGSRVPAFRTVCAIRGDYNDRRIVSSVSAVDAARRKTGVRVVTLGTYYLKDEFYSWLRLRPETDEAGRITGYPIGYCHLPNYPEVWGEYYYQGLTSEFRVVRKSGKIEWVRDPHVRNEPLDLAIYNRAAAHLVGIDGFREEDWRELENRLVRSIVSRPVAVANDGGGTGAGTGAEQHSLNGGQHSAVPLGADPSLPSPAAPASPSPSLSRLPNSGAWSGRAKPPSVLARIKF